MAPEPGFPGMTGRITAAICSLAMAGLMLVAVPAAAEPARVITDINYNADEVGPAQSTSNSLDLYLPATDDGFEGLRPVVVWVHGGAWMTGDKSNRMTDKVNLFNSLGYIVASLNYRLSPDISEGSFDGTWDPTRVRSPDHIADVAEGIAWVSNNVRHYGGDPDRLVLAGHSAGAHLVSLAGTSPAWIKGRRVSPKQIIGVVSLDTDTFDVAASADPANPANSSQQLALIWNAFGTPDEEAVEARWERSSPLAFADPADPPFLLVTQGEKVLRMAANDEMATALGQDPAQSVVGVPLDHEGINEALGSITDGTVETARVSQFVRKVAEGARPAGVRMVRRPARTIVVKRRGALRPGRQVRFGFVGTGRTSGFQCRIDRQPFTRCRSPRDYRLKPGKHVFRVRALYPSGRPGNERTVTFRIVRR